MGDFISNKESFNKSLVLEFIFIPETMLLFFATDSSFTSFIMTYMNQQFVYLVSLEILKKKIDYNLHKRNKIRPNVREANNSKDKFITPKYARHKGEQLMRR